MAVLIPSGPVRTGRVGAGVALAAVLDGTKRGGLNVSGTPNPPAEIDSILHANWSAVMIAWRNFSVPLM